MERLGIGVAVPVVAGRVAGDLGAAVERALTMGRAYEALPPRCAGDGATMVAERLVSRMALRIG